MRKRTQRVLLAALTVVFLVSGGMMLRQLRDYEAGKVTYEQAGSIAGLPDFSQWSWPEGSVSGGSSGEEAVPYVDPYADALAAMDFAALSMKQALLAALESPADRA